MREEMMPQTEIVFRITGDAYRRVIAWKQETDLAILRYQIETRGRTAVIFPRRSKRLGTIDEVPELGEAQPYYGIVGGAYVYDFYPQPQGTFLCVTNAAGGCDPFYPDPIPPLELGLAESARIRRASDEEGLIFKPHGGYTFLEETRAEDTDEMVFTVTQDLYPLWLEWERYGEALQSYAFSFIPSSIGCIVHIRHIATGEILDLTENVNW
ncbi:MAG: hypothetical protein JW741_17455 [Sedimentisphaerales bacterium]|nr:hypothetical protein [Sedimentisphaerales bacterium]